MLAISAGTKMRFSVARPEADLDRSANLGCDPVFWSGLPRGPAQYHIEPHPVSGWVSISAVTVRQPGGRQDASHEKENDEHDEKYLQCGSRIGAALPAAEQLHPGRSA